MLQDKKQTVQQQPSEVEAKKQQNSETASASTMLQHVDQDKKSKHDETLLLNEVKQQTEELPQNTVLVQEKMEQKQRKIVEEVVGQKERKVIEETQEFCIREELHYADNHSRLYEIEQEMMNGSTSKHIKAQILVVLL